MCGGGLHQMKSVDSLLEKLVYLKTSTRFELI